jgi:colicin import membrane protein
LPYATTYRHNSRLRPDSLRGGDLAWKKRARAPKKPGALDPKIAARVKQILAGKQKKSKAAPKGKAAKPKDARTSQEKANQNRAAVAKQGGMDKLEGVIVRLNAGMNSDMEKGAHDELISKGLATRGADGKAKLTPAGKKWKAAADKGDAEKAGAALAEGRAGASESAAKDKAKGEKVAARETAKAERVAKQQAKQAEKQKKLKQAAGKVKEKAKSAQKETAAKPGAKETSKEKPAAKPDAAANRAKVAKDMADQDAGLAPSGSAALSDFADGKPLDEKVAADFESMGLTEKDSTGAHRLTSDGKAAAAAMSKGDTRAALDAISRAKDKKKQGADKAKAGADKTTARAKTTTDKAAAAQRVEDARIEAARNRKALDMDDTLFSIDDLLAIKAGARHSRTDTQHLQSIHDSSVACGASCGPESDDEGEDDSEIAEIAEKAVKGIMDNPQWYAQHECGDIMQASSALSTLAMLIQSELSEEDEDAAHIDMLCDAARTLVKFIGAELDELEGAAGDAADTVRNGPMKAMDDYLHIDGGAIKATGDDTIRGYAVRFGDAEHPDLQKDYYTKATDFWLDHFGWPRPITYHHGMDAQTRNDPVIGHWLKAGVDDVGVWMEGQMDRAHAYYKAMKELAARGYLRMSSDSAPQWVIRERQTNGVNEIKRWPLVTSSLTPTPMEPRMLPVEVKALMAEVGLDAIDTGNPEAIQSDAVKADGRQAADERARRLTLELELLHLMETA